MRAVGRAIEAVITPAASGSPPSVGIELAGESGTVVVDNTAWRRRYGASDREDQADYHFGSSRWSGRGFGLRARYPLSEWLGLRADWTMRVIDYEAKRDGVMHSAGGFASWQLRLVAEARWSWARVSVGLTDGELRGNRTWPHMPIVGAVSLGPDELHLVARWLDSDLVIGAFDTHGLGIGTRVGAPDRWGRRPLGLRAELVLRDFISARAAFSAQWRSGRVAWTVSVGRGFSTALDGVSQRRLYPAYRVWRADAAFICDLPR